MKATINKTAKAVNVAFNAEPTSLKDAGYKVAQAGEALRAVAQYVIDHAPAILEDMSVNSHKELRADLAEGYKLRAYELWGQDYYVVSKDTGTWLHIGNSAKTPDIQAKLDEFKGREIKQINVHYVTSITSNEFGKMAKDDPAQRAVIEPVRNKWRKYEQDRNDSLIKAIKDIVRESKGEKKTREIVLFDASVKKAFDAFDKSVKVKQERGDETADPLRFRLAVDAFWKTYNAK